MEEVCAVEGGASGGGDGDRKLTPHHHRQHLALKCPRCDSFNTKFCYYNNYNQSQPRHFCKSCRRYWTKGGVLRNVPVGGGNRKPSKLSKSKAGTAKARKSHSHSHPCIESSNPAAETMATAALTSATNEVASAVDFGYIIPDSTAYNVNPQAWTNPSFDSQPPPANHSTDSQIFTEIGFTSLENMLGFNTVDNSTSFDPKLERASFVENHSTEIMNQTVHQVDFAEETAMSDGGLAAALDWGSADAGVLGGRCVDEGLFDVTGAVDQAHWGDQSLNYLI